MANPTPLPDYRFPVDPWRLTELEYCDDDLGHTETLFAVGNGYIGMRANPEEGRNAHSHGTYVNGFHETWQIKHAENAYGFATTGQTIVNAPDAKLMKLYVDDEPLLLETAEPERLRANPRLSHRRVDPQLRLAHPRWQTSPRGFHAPCQLGAPPSRSNDVRGHSARRRCTNRHLLAADEPARRRGRVSRSKCSARRGRRHDRSAPGQSVRRTRPRANVERARWRPDRPRLPLHQQRDDVGSRYASCC